MKLTFQATSSERIVAVTGDNGYSRQSLTTPASVVRGDTLVVTANLNPYLPSSSPWRLMTEDGRVLPWIPSGTAAASDIIDLYAQELAARRPA